MTLGAQHVKPTGLDDFVVLGGHRVFPFGDRVGPGGLVFFGRVDRRQAALRKFLLGKEFWVSAEHDVGASTGHVGGHGDGALATGLGDDRRFFLVVLGVQHFVRNSTAQQHARQQLGLLDAHRADEHRLALFVTLGDVVDDGLELRLLRLVDDVGLVGSLHRPVGGNRHHAEFVGLVELGRLRVGGACHAR